MTAVRAVVFAFLGGCAGSAARHGVALAAAAAGWPDFAGRIAVNVLGGFLAGLYLARREGDPTRMARLEPLVAAGFLGGFTTVAGYALDAATAFEAGATSTLAILLVFDGAVGLLAAALGHRLARTRPSPAH